MEEERRTTAQKRSYGSVPAESGVNFTFQHPRHGDGGMSAISEKCRCCFLYRNTLEIENLYPQDEAGVVGGEPVRVPPQPRLQPRSDSMQKFLEKNNMWLMPHPLYSQDLASCNFFIFPKLKLVLKE